LEGPVASIFKAEKEERGSNFLRNFDKLLLDYNVSQPTI
jgi:hypothetical protein